MLCYVVSCHIILYYIISYHIITYHIISYHTIPYHTVPYHTIPYYTIPYYTILYYITLYYIILYYIILYYINESLHVLINYIVTFRTSEQQQFQNHNCKHYVRSRIVISDLLLQGANISYCTLGDTCQDSSLRGLTYWHYVKITQRMGI
jgi:hypothetical protein